MKKKASHKTAKTSVMKTRGASGKSTVKSKSGGKKVVAK